MSDHFYLHFNPQPIIDDSEISVSWCRVSAEGDKQLGDGSLAEAAQASEEAHITVILPGQHCAAYQAQLPGMNRRRQAQAVPNMLEEQLIDDIDDLHFALGSTHQDALDVLVVRNSLMAQWLTQLQSQQIVAQHMVADYQTILLPKDGWHLWFDDDGILLRTGSASGMRVALTEPMLLLECLYQEVNEKPTSLRVSGDSESLEEDLQQWCDRHQISLQQEPESNFLEQAVDALAKRKGVNLLQGSYSYKENMSRQWRPWWPAVAVVVVMVVIQMITVTVDYFRLQQQSVALQQDIESLYRETFPDARKVVDARAQMAARLTAMQQQGGDDLFYQLLTGVTHLAENKVDFELQRLRFQAGELNVDLHLQDLQVLDRIKQLLSQQQGIQAEVVSASARGDKVEARLLIKEGA